LTPSSNATDANLIYNQYCASSASRIFLIGPLDRLTDRASSAERAALEAVVAAVRVVFAVDAAAETVLANTRGVNCENDPYGCDDGLECSSLRTAGPDGVTEPVHQVAQ
jgi:hypothetical protein